MPRALIVGVDGQDGSYLAEFLLSKGYEVVGWVPYSLPISYANIQHLLDNGSELPIGRSHQFWLIKGDLADQASLLDCLEQSHPDEVYNLAAPSFPATSWSFPVHVGDIAGVGVTRLLEAVRRATPKARFYQASSSELFGVPVETPQREITPFHPRNPYGIAKLYAHWMTIRYREYFGLWACAGILFNHESPRRGLDFVTRKISHTAARIKLGQADQLHLGNLDARRDWGYAADYVLAMWLMLQNESPSEYVIGTGVTHSVREFCEIAFACLDLDYRDYVVQDPNFMRPPETAQLVANPAKAKQELGWESSISFEQLVCRMVESDMVELSNPRS